MTVNNHAEAYIPFRRTDLIHLCVEDGKLEATQIKTFLEFCEILSAFYHFRFHKTLETIKDNYVVFHPHSDVKPLFEPELEGYETMKNKVIESFQSVLEQANYRPLSKEYIQKVLDKKSLIDLQTDINFNDFEALICYYRGDQTKTIKVKKFLFWEKSKVINIFERVVLLVYFKGEQYFQAKATKKKTIKDLNFKPGKMYIYFYKNIPQFDIDLLFPNLETSMTLKDRLMFGIPAIGAAVPLGMKILPNLVVIIAAILLTINVTSGIHSIDIKQNDARDIMAVLVATLSLTLALGGFASRQYNKYKNKQLKFQKEVTETLFFKSLSNHFSAFQMIVDLAEEEECKEIILVYYHLLTSPQPLTPQQLDHKIETWVKEKVGISINFDIHSPLKNLQSIQGKLTHQQTNQNSDSLIPLLSYDDQNRCQVVPLEEAKAIIDYVWDNAFHYNNCH